MVKKKPANTIVELSKGNFVSVEKISISKNMEREEFEKLAVTYPWLYPQLRQILEGQAPQPEIQV